MNSVTLLDAVLPHLLYAQTAPAAQGAQSGTAGFASMVPMLAIFFAFMYFMMIRPQQKRDRERRELLASLEKGDAVVTTGGICGKIVRLSESHVTLQVDDKTEIEFIRSAVAQVTKRTNETKSK